MVSKSGNIFAFLCLIAVVFAISRYAYTYYELRSFGETTSAIIDSVDSHASHRRIFFEFTVNGKVHHGTTTFKHPWNPRQGDTITIRYSLKDPNVYQVVR